MDTPVKDILPYTLALSFLKRVSFHRRVLISLNKQLGLNKIHTCGKQEEPNLLRLALRWTGYSYQTKIISMFFSKARKLFIGSVLATRIDRFDFLVVYEFKRELGPLPSLFLKEVSADLLLPNLQIGSPGSHQGS